MIIQDVFINYTSYGKEDAQTIVFLHGWGQNIDMMRPLADFFKENHHIVIVDLPGHGNSSEPKFAWTVFDYAKAINEFLIKLNIDKPIILGHSFGGKVGLLYASMYEVEKLILFGSPFRKDVEKISFKVRILKTLKKVPVINKLEDFAKKRMGSTDYKNASGIMRQVLVGTVNLDISEEVKKIKCPTLIIWGTKDEAVSVEDAYILEKLIDNSGVVVLENGTHYAYLEQLNYVVSIIKNLLEG